MRPRRTKFDLQKFPQRERSVVSAIQDYLEWLEIYTDDFEYALALFDYCMESLRDLQHPFQMWTFLAADGAIIAASNFQETIRAIGISVRQCKFRTMVDVAHLSEVIDKYGKAFPKLRAIRHRSVHTIKPGKQNEFSGTRKSPYIGLNDVIGAKVRRCLEERNYTTTIDKQIVTCSISRNSLTHLVTVRNIFLAAFDPFDLK